MNAKPFDKGTIIFPHIFRTAVPIFTIFGQNVPHLSYNTTVIKWFTTPKQCKYITPWNVTMHIYNWTPQLLSYMNMAQRRTV